MPRALRHLVSLRVSTRHIYYHDLAEYVYIARREPEDYQAPEELEHPLIYPRYAPRPYPNSVIGRKSR